MHADSRPSDLVRCLACHEIYEQPLRPSDSGDSEAACPSCGHLAWLAVRIPTDDTERSLPA